MLFDYGADIIESDKERNLYYKFFAAYYFNELVAGFEQRLRTFDRLLSSESDAYINYETGSLLNLSPQSTHITFDAHAYILDPHADRGEFADILIHDRSRSIVVAIEAKFLTDWNVEKDILANLTRRNNITTRNPELNLIQCLLITGTKWSQVQRLANHPRSSYTALQQQTGVSLIILTWEKLIETCENKAVREYFRYHITQGKDNFRRYGSKK